MIFLQDNVYLKRELSHDDVKPRLLGKYPAVQEGAMLTSQGHWGSCPGLVLVYSHLNYMIKKYNLDMLYVVGPGHGAPAILSCLWLEGSLERFYPHYARDTEGLNRLVTNFSTPSGLPRLVFLGLYADEFAESISHINSETPGAIHEGGELGYALSVSFGAVMDKPDLIVTCIIGDGEAETGPTATLVACVPAVRLSADYM